MFIQLLVIVWLAGGFATLGAMKGIYDVESIDISDDIKFRKFILSWYTFGTLVGILLGEILKQNKTKE